ncbi:MULTISPECIES: hypothetical protein [Vibrio]|uniref:hypothetical protein n=1 Tax=Vibrio TaxID=662 RepID=UPI00188CBF0F|nr:MULTISPECIES: hypothetical protein [Vibrio]MBF4230609.1 hypothetical protein [Vibrio anguillarum]MDF9388288.1 hypothetical protein [Vibrio sp. 1151_11]
MKLKNLKGTSNNTCHCNSWLDHWLEYSGANSLPSQCGEKSCLNSPEVGAHVIKVNSTDKKWYIVPLCKKHNKEDEEFELYSSIKLAPALVSETCG